MATVDATPAPVADQAPIASTNPRGPSRQRWMVSAGVGALGLVRRSSDQAGAWGYYGRFELNETPMVSVRYERDLAGAALVGASVGYATTGLPPFRSEWNEHWVDVGVLIGMHRTWQLRRIAVEPRLVLGAGYSQHIASVAAAHPTPPDFGAVPRTSPGFEASVLTGLGLRLSGRIGLAVETGYAHHRTIMRMGIPSSPDGLETPLILVARFGQWTTQLSLVIHL